MPANNLTMSLYGAGLESGSAYIGGTTGIKTGISQKYDFTGIYGITTAPLIFKTTTLNSTV